MSCVCLDELLLLLRKLRTDLATSKDLILASHEKRRVIGVNTISVLLHGVVVSGNTFSISQKAAL